jgi:ribonuclease P protein component
MLPIKQRLKSKKDFNNLFRSGKTLSNDVFLMKYAQGAEACSQIGFSVGVKFSKKTVERNKVKRWMREAVRTMMEDVRPGFQIIFLTNSKFPYKQMSFSLTKGKLRDLLGKAKLLK